jgi:branched-chain amino acid transport system substrate-binding protein
MKMTRTGRGGGGGHDGGGAGIAQSLHFPDAELPHRALRRRRHPFADGYADYLTLINERDGGIGGVPIRMSECETAYNTERGVECYQAIRGDNPLVSSRCRPASPTS